MKIYFILVIYEMLIEDSDTYRSICSYFNENPSSDFELIIYDNSKMFQKINLEPFVVCSYIHDPANGGLSRAYNYALSLIRQNEDWLVLLDQDSVIPHNFFDDLRVILKARDNQSFVAVVPHIVAKHRLISPYKVLMGGRKKTINEDFVGLCEREIAAVNSGLTVRTSFMRQIGGFTTEFWLDYLDYWLCRTIYARGEKIYVSSSKIDHSLSVSNYKEVSVQRAQNILHAEINFYKKYKSRFEQVIFFFRLLVRGLKQYLKLRNKNIAINTLKGTWRLITIESR